MTKQVAILGLGTMGKPMAMNLARCGEELIVNDVRTIAYPEFAAKNIKTTGAVSRA